jgi:hypothetical protein
MLHEEHDLVASRLRPRIDIDLDARLVPSGLAFLLAAGDGEDRFVRLSIKQIGVLRPLHRPGGRGDRTGGHQADRRRKKD